MFDTGAVGDPTHQQHDWEPGIADSGLFWTTPVAASALDYDLDTGEARLRLTNVAILDYHDFFNAVVGGGPQPVPSHVSFDVRWAGGGDRLKLRDEDFGFGGQFVTGAATISFTARQDGSNVTYTADTAGQYNPGPEQGGAGSPAIGHERNGVYFH